MPRHVFVLTFLLLGLSASLAAQTADLSVTKVDDPDPVTAASPLVYTITVSNEGPDSAAGAMLSDPLPASTTFQSLAAPAGWSCSTPAVGANGTISCSDASFGVGSAVFTLTVGVDPGVASCTVLTNTVTVSSSTPDPHPGTETASAGTTVVAATTAIAISKVDSPDPVVEGADLTYTITASNNGALGLESAAVTPSGSGG